MPKKKEARHQTTISEKESNVGRDDHDYDIIVGCSRVLRMCTGKHVLL